MAVVKVYDQDKTEQGELTLTPEVFEVAVRPEILHLVVRAQLAAKRAGTHSTKTRAMVSGGGVKPWRQKGTGRARAGSNRSPVWRGGAILFGPQPRKYDFKVNKKIRKLALKMALSARNQEGNMVVVDQFTLAEIKTRDFVKVMDNFKFDNCLVVTGEADETLGLSSRNVVGYKVLPVAGLNVMDILKHSKLMLVQTSLAKLEERLMV